ncbi:MAG: MFS transporter [Candidatus Heimdallarchaeaceae archaeon]
MFKAKDNVFWIIAIRTLIGLNRRLIRYSMPLFLIFLNWNEFYYGLLFSVAGYLATGAIIGLGYITDLQKRKYTMIIGICFSAISLELFSIASIFENKGLMIATYSLFGISGSLVQLALTTLLADITPSKQEKTKNFGFLAFFFNLTGVIAPLIGGGYLALYSKFHPQKEAYISLFLIVALILALSVILALKLPIPETTKKEARKIAKDDEWKNFEQKGKKVLFLQYFAFFFSEALIGFTSGIAIPFLQYYIINEVLDGYKNTDQIWSIILSLSNVGISVGNLIMIPMTKKLGNELSLGLLHFLVPILALGIALSTNVYSISTFFVLRSSAANMSRPAWNSFFYSWIPPEVRGTGTGIVNAGRRLSRALGTQSGSFIYVALGVWTFPIATIAYPIAILVPILVQYFIKTVNHRDTVPTIEIEERF